VGGEAGVRGVLIGAVTPTAQELARVRDDAGSRKLCPRLVAQHAAYDTRETTQAARAAFARRFEREVDPDGVLPEPERARRAEAAKRAHFQRMALRSAHARRRRS
jgi:hypothetical protein